MTTDTTTISDSCDELSGTATSVTTDEARSRLKETLFSVLQAGENRVIDASTSLGKSYQVATTPWREHPEVTEDNLVIHIHQTTESRDEAVEESEEAGVSYHVLKGREDSCPAAAGEYDDRLTSSNGLPPSKWFDWMCDVRKIPFAKAHSRLNAECGLPCTAYTNCQSMIQWWEDLRDKNGSPTVDVVHTTANFAHVTELIEGANLVFDERPNYGLTLNDTQRQQFRDSLANLLNYRSDGQFALFDLQEASIRDYPELTAELCELFEEDVKPEWYFGYDETHRLAPKIGLAMLDAEEVLPGRWMGEHQDVKVVLNGDGKFRYVHYSPDFTEARCVVGLDAYPTGYRWRLNTVENLTHTQVLTAQERNRWRREERGLTVVQVGDATRSYSNGWDGAGKERAGGLIRHLYQKHGDAFRTCISSDDTEIDVRRMMEKVGIESPGTMHYGAQNSRNTFENESIGLLAGCIDPGDKTILDLLALGGRNAQPETMRREDGDVIRMPGRSFVGPDADVAEKLLESVRETNLAQAAGRYARNPDSQSSSATVYVWSDACPNSLIDDVLSPNYHSLKGKRKTLAESLKDESLQTARQLHQTTGVNKSYIIECLNLFESHGIAKKREGTGHQGADEWWWIGGDFWTLVELE